MFGDKVPVSLLGMAEVCKVTPVILHGLVSPEVPLYALSELLRDVRAEARGPYRGIAGLITCGGSQGS